MSKNKQPKIILFDIDQVLIRPPYFYSTILQQQGYDQAEEVLHAYFTEENYKCIENKTNILETILPYLRQFGWEKSSEEYCLEQFAFESQFLDHDLIKLIAKLRKQNIICCTCTDQEAYRAKYLLEEMDFDHIFDRHYMAYQIAYRKCHDEFWQYVLSDIAKTYGKIDPTEIAFFDDIQNNIDIASKFGVNAILFTDVERFMQDIQAIFTKN